MKKYKFFNGCLDFPIDFYPSEIEADEWVYLHDMAAVTFTTGGERAPFATYQVNRGWFIHEIKPSKK